MTLLELVVGLTVTALVLAAGFGAVAMLGDRRAAAAEVVREDARAAAVRWTLTDWLAGARLTVEQSGPAFRGLDGTRDDLPDDELSFLTTARTPLGERETVVRLFVDRDPATPERGLTAELIEWPGQAARRLEIEPKAAGLDARYRTRMASVGLTLPSWISSTVLPAGIEVTLSAAAGDSLPPVLALPIVVPFRGGR